MTREEIMDLKTGSKTNELIVENIMGYKHYIGSEIPSGIALCRSAQGDQEMWINDKGWAFCKWCGSVPNYSSDVLLGQDVLRQMKGCLFSIRKRFMEELTVVVSRRLVPDKTYCIAWPDVMWHIEPIDICKAALLTVLAKDK